MHATPQPLRVPSIRHLHPSAAAPQRDSGRPDPGGHHDQRCLQPLFYHALPSSGRLHLLPPSGVSRFSSQRYEGSEPISANYEVQEDQSMWQQCYWWIILFMSQMMSMRSLQRFHLSWWMDVVESTKAFGNDNNFKTMRSSLRRRRFTRWSTMTIGRTRNASRSAACRFKS